MTEYCFSVDIGGTSIKFGLFDIQGVLLEKWMCPTNLENKGIAIIPDIVSSIQNKMRERRINISEILGIGIGAPGQVNARGDVLIAENLGWRQVALGSEIEREMGVLTKVENDANMAAFGELHYGSGIGYKSMVLVTIGTGIGCGVILNGRILQGKNGAAGELGHMHMEDAVREQCSCGNYGCLEQLASARGIVSIAEYFLEVTKDDSLLCGECISAKKIFNAAKKRDTLAIRTVECFGNYLGKALAACACVIDPEMIVIGGGVSRAGSIVIEYIQKYYQQYAFMDCKNIRISLAKLGNDAGIYGAAKMVEYSIRKRLIISKKP